MARDRNTRGLLPSAPSGDVCHLPSTICLDGVGSTSAASWQAQGPIGGAEGWEKDSGVAGGHGLPLWLCSPLAGGKRTMGTWWTHFPTEE